MPTDHRERLGRIRSFTQLIVYLRDDLGWPIVSDDFEELTFEYTPAELGIDAKNAAKIQEVKRLRPLVPGQPWGIFFVKFEPKRLPVVALRRILGQVALKRRASANKSERQAWAADDLLFVSNYGEGDKIPKRVQKQLAGCLSWADLWKEVPDAPDRDSVRSHLERLNFRPLIGSEN